MAKSPFTRQVSEIDRLIELASDEQSPSPNLKEAHAELSHTPITALSLEDKKDPRPSMWRILLQLRVLLPYLARVLPLLERSVLGTNVLSAGGGAALPTPADHHREEEYEEIRASLRDLNGQLKSQTADIKYLQERLTWISKSFESETQRQAQTLEALTSLKKTLRTWAISIVVLLLVVLGAILILMFRA